MRILVIPDIHLKTWIFDRAEDILKASKADQAVCLMDIPDDWDMEFQTEMYKETFDSGEDWKQGIPHMRRERSCPSLKN